MRTKQLTGAAVLNKHYGSHTNITLDEAEILLKTLGYNSPTRVYATFKDGVYVNQIDRMTSVTKLQETITAYSVTLWASTMTTDDLIRRA